MVTRKRAPNRKPSPAKGRAAAPARPVSARGGSPELSKEQKVFMLRQMITIRRFEEEVKRLYRAGDITGAIHLYIGQEAVAVGACQALRKDDYVTSTHRPHGHCLAKVFKVKPTMAEMMGRVTGLSKGRGGSMHQFDLSCGFLGGNGIVGGGIPLAIGAAFSAQYRETGAIAVCFFGDGASKQGTFHESFNLAALWDLPIVFVCENNCYAATTPVSDSCPVADIAELAHGYGAPGKTVEGNDVLAVHELAQEAVAHARSGRGPFLLEAKTYRMKPHCMVIRETRDQGELAGWAEKDPIARFEQRLQDEGWLTADEIASVRAEVEATLAAAAQFALDSPWPDPATVAQVLWA